MSDYTGSDDKASNNESNLMSANQVSVSFSQLIIMIGFILGIVIAWGVFSGDSLGRVNLIHLIFLYVFFPIFSLGISAVSLIFGKGINLSKIIGYFPILPSSMKRSFLLQSQRENAKLYFFYQSQLAALSFSLASLLVFLLLLVSSDINFVWRSTLMDAEFIYPLLQYIAIPWKFWEAAQPDLSLLIATQESRLNGHQAIGINFGDWWQFILAGQIFYAVTLRSITALVCRLFIIHREKKAITSEVYFKNNHHDQPMANSVPQYTLATVANQVKNNYSLTNWAGIPQDLVDEITSKLDHSAVSQLKAGPLASVSEQLLAERWQETQIIIVKGWEPPMGELADYLENGKGYVLTVDWKVDQLTILSDFHLDEWRRFMQGFSNWQLLQLKN